MKGGEKMEIIKIEDEQRTTAEKPCFYLRENKLKMDYKEVLRKINKLVPLFNKKIKEGYTIRDFKKIRTDYLEKYGVDINDYVKLCFNKDLSLNCLMFKGG